MHWTKTSLYAIGLMALWTFVSSLPLEETLEAKNPAIGIEPIAPLIGEKHEFEISKSLPGADVALNITKLIKTIENVGDVIPTNIVEKATQKTVIDNATPTRRKREVDIATSTASVIDLDSSSWEQKGKVIDFKFPEAPTNHSRRKRDRIETNHNLQTPPVGRNLVHEKEINQNISVSQTEDSKDHVQKIVPFRRKREDQELQTKTKVTLEGATRMNSEGKKSQVLPGVPKEKSQKIDAAKAQQEWSKESSASVKQIEPFTPIAQLSSQETSTHRTKREKSRGEAVLEDSKMELKVSKKEQVESVASFEPKANQKDPGSIASVAPDESHKTLPSKAKREASEEKPPSKVPEVKEKSSTEGPDNKEPEPIAPVTHEENRKILPSRAKRETSKEKSPSKVPKVEEKSLSEGPDSKEPELIVPLELEATQKTLFSSVKREALKEKSPSKVPEVKEKSSSEGPDNKEPEAIAPVTHEENRRTLPSRVKRETSKEKNPLKDPGIEKNPSSRDPAKKEPEKIDPFEPEGIAEIPISRIKRQESTSSPKNLDAKQSTGTTSSIKDPHSGIRDRKELIETSTSVTDHVLHKPSTPETLSTKIKREVKKLDSATLPVEEVSQKPSKIKSNLPRNKREEKLIKTTVATPERLSHGESVYEATTVKETDSNISVSESLNPKIPTSNLDEVRRKREDKGFDSDTPVDKDYDMDLEEVNVFRPLFRYRASFARQQPIG